jgi:hypothetical protein
MKRGRSVLAIFVCVCALAFIERTAEQAFGVQRATNEQASSVGHPKSSSEQTQKSARKIVSPTGLQRRPEAIQKSANQMQTELKRTPLKGRLQAKVGKKVTPKAVVQPRTDLMYYGILEDSQRYDPRPNPHTAGVPNPQTPDLTHDHFQELDRNQDGKIDPVERAFGRLDMDRDLHNRQPY